MSFNVSVSPSHLVPVGVVSRSKFDFSLHGFKIMTHPDAALYTARRLEMCQIVELTLFYLHDRPTVHSPVSGLPFMVFYFESFAETEVYSQDRYVNDHDL